MLATESENRLAAIADFTFNLGAGRLQTSTLRRRINQQDWTGTARELRRWNSSGEETVKAFYSATTRQLDGYSPIAFNGVTPLYPATIEVGRPTPSYFCSMMGYAPGVRLLRMNGQYVNKDIVTLGGSDWMVFSMSYGGYGFLK